MTQVFDPSELPDGEVRLHALMDAIERAVCKDPRLEMDGYLDIKALAEHLLDEGW